MKYGILTYHNIPNFGAVLQAYALWKKLDIMEVDCEIIDYACNNIVRRELTPKRTGSIVKDVAYYLFIWSRQRRKIEQCQKFIERCCSKRKYTVQSIGRANQEYDGFISGSDMIWNLDVNGRDFSFFLDFAEAGKRKLSYGSSVDGKWPEADLKHIGDCLKTYRAISAREEVTSEIIRDRFGLDCKTVCDPTMLLCPEEWERFTFTVKENGYVVVYFAYPNILDAARKYAKQHHKELIILSNAFPWKREKHKMQYSPAEWLSYIRYADAVFTDSYHGFLFSLYFERPVWTNNKGSRLHNLLERCELEQCLIENDLNFDYKIDFPKTKARISEFRNYSEAYLRWALNIEGKEDEGLY